MGCREGFAPTVTQWNESGTPGIRLQGGGGSVILTPMNQTGKNSRRRRWPWLVSCAVLVLAVLVWIADWQPRFLSQLLHRDGRVIFHGPDTARRVALTIDDAPSPATPAILDVLRRHEVRATFFLMAGEAERNADLIRRIVSEGHEIGNHLWEDRPAYAMSRGEFEDALERSQAALEAFAPVRWFRPPHAVYTDRMLDAAEARGLITVLGSLHPYDTAVPSVDYAVSQISRNARPGDIIVLHDGGDRGHRTAVILDEVLPLLRRGSPPLDAGTLSRLLDPPDPSGIR